MTEPVVRRTKRIQSPALLVDRIASFVISLGGAGVLTALLVIMAFLIFVAAPLFRGGEAGPSFDGHVVPGSQSILADFVDDHRIIAASLDQAGAISAFHIPTGTPLAIGQSLPTERTLRTISVSGNSGQFAVGLDDGAIMFGSIEIKSESLAAGEAPESLRTMADGSRSDGMAVYTTLPSGQIHRTSISVLTDPPETIVPNHAVVALDARDSGTSERPLRIFALQDDTGSLYFGTITIKKNLLTGVKTSRTNIFMLPSLPGSGRVRKLLLNDTADTLYVLAEDNILYRYDLRDPAQARIAEQVRLAPADDPPVHVAFQAGRQSLIVSDAGGSLHTLSRLPEKSGSDGYELVKTHSFESQPGSVGFILAGDQSHVLATLSDTGGVWLRNATSAETLLKLPPPAQGGKARAALLAGRDDALVVFYENGDYCVTTFSLGYPEGSFKALFGKIWYEGYREPGFTWQSSSGSDIFEPKFSLIPLIFGTVKGALISLIFAAPLALAAAIFTSEFMTPRARTLVKPAMEIMASLPSVVLGFIAALVLAPFIESHIVSVILCFIVGPLSLIIGAHLWSLLPRRLLNRFAGIMTFLTMGLFLLLGIASAVILTPFVEQGLFAGDFRKWAAGQIGSDIPLLTIVLLPLSYVIIEAEFEPALHGLRRVMPFLPGRIDPVGAKIVFIALTILLSLVVATGLEFAGFGLRGGIIASYVQRNSLVAGFAMAFAVMPIIYTIAEDALAAVPQHLRAASLACGASPWQTAVKVVVPAAASGILAAIMIGLGRAIGETMVMVMVAGNTPILDWNIFAGLRALSANIAVELPEAAKDSTLYRILFFSALVLLVMTFFVNTLAELVRQRFRRRAAQL